MGDALLDDLDALGSDDEDSPRVGATGGAGVNIDRSAGGRGVEDLDDLSDDDGSDEDGDAAGAAAAESADIPRDAELDAQIAALRAAPARTGYRAVARLRETKRFLEHMERVRDALAAPAVPPVIGTLEDWPEYRLVLASNALDAALDEELATLHAYIIAAYAPKFPELANIIPSPAEYVRTVRRIANEMDLTLVDLSDVLPSAQIMVVTVTASTTAGRQLSADALADVLAACGEFAAIEAAKAEVLAFIESRMGVLAPNVSSLLGTRVAALLVGVAGGVGALARIPSCNVQVLGAARRRTTASSTGLARGPAAAVHSGVAAECDLVRSAPPQLRRKVLRVLAAKVVLAARVDGFRERADGSLGTAFRADIAAKLRKWLEPAPGKQKRPLPAPDDKRTKRRGGRRHRALKEKLGITDVRREVNRTAFAAAGGGPGGEYSAVAMGVDLGMLGASGSGRLKLERKEQRIVKKRRIYENGGDLGGSSGATGGAASSLVFTPSQGIALANPAAAAERAAAAYAAGSAYFSTTGAFSSVRPGT